MADLTWPDIRQPNYDNCTVQPVDSSIHTSMDDGIIVGRRKFTGKKKKFKLVWTGMSTDDYDTMMDFIENTVYVGALPFTWTCPWDQKTYTVYIESVEEWTPSYETWSGTINFREA